MAATSLTLSSSLPPPTLADARGAAALVAGCAEPATAKRLKALCSDESTWSDVTGDSLRGAAAVSQMMLAALDSSMPAAVRVDLLDCVTWYVAWTAKAGKPETDALPSCLELLSQPDTPRKVQLAAARLFCAGDEAFRDDALVQLCKDIGGGDGADARRAAQIFSAVTHRTVSTRYFGITDRPSIKLCNGMLSAKPYVGEAVLHAMGTAAPQFAAQVLGLLAATDGAVQWASSKDKFLGDAISGLLGWLRSTTDGESRRLALEALERCVLRSDRGQELLLGQVPSAVDVLTACLVEASTDTTRCIGSILGCLAFHKEVREALGTLGELAVDGSGEASAADRACSLVLGQVMNSKPGYLAVLEEVGVSVLAQAACAHVSTQSQRREGAYLVIRAIGEFGSAEERAVLMALGPCGVLAKAVHDDDTDVGAWRALCSLLTQVDGAVDQALGQPTLMDDLLTALTRAETADAAAYEASRVVSAVINESVLDGPRAVLDDSRLLPALFAHFTRWNAIEAGACACVAARVAARATARVTARVRTTARVRAAACVPFLCTPAVCTLACDLLTSCARPRSAGL